MKHDKEHLDIDLDFLDKKDGKDAPKAKPKPAEHSTASSDEKTPPPPTSDVETVSSEYKYNWRNILIVGGIILFFGWAIFSGSSSDTSTSSTYTPPVVSTSNTVVPPITTTPTVKADADVPVVPKAKTDSQICKADYGSHSYATGEKNSTGGPACDCQTGYVWNDGQTACVVAPPAPKTGYEICQDRNGVNATYDSASNSCGCVSGYSLSATTNQCVDVLTARDDSCAASYPGTSFLKYDTTSNKNICECKAGYNWNNDRTACYTTASFNQSCVSTFGTGAYSTTENGKRVCDCGYGYSFNAQRNMCVTTASINAMCERDVGRNSKYDGTVTDGKYNCTEPY
jgi:hypothetical protein